MNNEIKKQKKKPIAKIDRSRTSDTFPGLLKKPTKAKKNGLGVSSKTSMLLHATCYTLPRCMEASMLTSRCCGASADKHGGRRGD